MKKRSLEASPPPSPTPAAATPSAPVDEDLFPTDLPPDTEQPVDAEDEEEEEEEVDEAAEFVFEPPPTRSAAPRARRTPRERKQQQRAEDEEEEDEEEEVVVVQSESTAGDRDDIQKDTKDNSTDTATATAAAAKPRVVVGVLHLDKPQRRAKSGSKSKAAAAAAAAMEVESSDTDTSEDEHARNTVGRIPMHWYDEYPHIGYDLDGKKIAKTGQKKDHLDAFLDKMDNENYNRTVYDPVTGKEIVLTDEEVAMVKRIQAGQFPESGVDPYEDYVDFYSSEPMQTPVTGVPEPKSSFIPSKWEHKQVMKMVRAIRKGLLKVGKKPKDEEEKVYDLWSDAPVSTGLPEEQRLPPPKMFLPGHAESYNPPPEYLPTAEEAEEWKAAHPEDRKRDFLPQKFDSLRQVPAFENFVNERFQRCLDLYLCPRAKRIRPPQIDPESLLPKLPSPKDLQPFPTAISLEYLGHKSAVTCLSCDPTGQWLATGSDDKSVRVWEVATGRCMKTVEFDNVVNAVQWCLNPQLSLLAVAVDTGLYLIQPDVGTKAACAAADSACKAPSTPVDKPGTSKISWVQPSADKPLDASIRLMLSHPREIRQVAWHLKGNYFAVVCPGGTHDAVFVHSLNKHFTQTPFRKKMLDVQKVLFHPRQPIFFLATKTHVRIYNLQTQTLVKTLDTRVKWLSSLAIHPGGDNVIVGSFDRRLAWFDLDLSVKPYKTLRFHRFALRQVCFHSSYPLFASCSDDGSIHILHGMVYDDLTQNALIVPVKILKGHTPTAGGLGVMDCQFHPRQPWIFSAGADGRVFLFT